MEGRQLGPSATTMEVVIMTVVDDLFNRNKILPFSRNARSNGAASKPQGPYPSMPAPLLTVADALTKYLRDHGEFLARTKEDYLSHFRYFRNWAMDEGISVERLYDISEEIVTEYRNFLMGEYAKNTVNIRMNTLRAFLKWCYDEGFMAERVYLRLKKAKIDRKSIRFLTEEQVAGVLRQMNLNTFEGIRNFVLVLVLLDNGVRIKELLNIQWSMIDFVAGEINLPYFITKTQKMRKIPLSKEKTVPALKYLKAHNDEHFPDNPYVFLSCRGKQLDPSTVRHYLRDYGLKAGIPGVSPHRFRHTFARMYVLGRGDVFMLQQILGHTTLEMSRLYVEIFSTEVAEKHQEISPVNRLLA